VPIVATSRTGARAVTIAAIAVVLVGAVLWFARRPAPREGPSVATTKDGVVSENTNLTRSSDSPPRAPASEPAGSGAGSTAASDPIGSPDAYPVNLEALRARLPDNRYWTLGAPTSDRAVAKARADRAERDNAAFGRIQSNEASPAEIHAYYAERRAISRDYLQLAELVLEAQGQALSPRDRGLFELSARLHRARLQQIERDESDALARRATR